MLSKDITTTIKNRTVASLSEIVYDLKQDKVIVNEVLQSLVRHGRIEELSAIKVCAGSCSCSSTSSLSCSMPEKTYRLASSDL